MTLQQLKYAVEIARCGSITKAAGHLFISQPSLSNAIMELETEIGITIFKGRADKRSQLFYQYILLPMF